MKTCTESSGNFHSFLFYTYISIVINIVRNCRQVKISGKNLITIFLVRCNFNICVNSNKLSAWCDHCNNGKLGLEYVLEVITMSCPHIEHLTIWQSLIFNLICSIIATQVRYGLTNIGTFEF